MAALVKDIGRGTKFRPRTIYEHPVLPMQWDEMVALVKNFNCSIEATGDEYVMTILEPEKIPLVENIKEWTVYFYDNDNKKSWFSGKYAFKSSGSNTYSIPALEVQKEPTDGYQMQCSLSAYGGGRDKPNYYFSMYVTNTPAGQSVSLSINIYYNDIEYYWSIDRNSI